MNILESAQSLLSIYCVYIIFIFFRFFSSRQIITTLNKIWCKSNKSSDWGGCCASFGNIFLHRLRIDIDTPQIVFDTLEGEWQNQVHRDWCWHSSFGVPIIIWRVSIAAPIRLTRIIHMKGANLTAKSDLILKVFRQCHDIFRDTRITDWVGFMSN